LQFLVHDDDTPLANLSIKATSDNPSLIPNNGSGLNFFNSGTNQVTGLPNNNTPQTSLVSLNINPASFQFGDATITIAVTDPQAIPNGTNAATPSFLLHVNKFNPPPFFITAPPAQSVAAGGTLANIPFAVASPVDAANTIVVTKKSSDQSLVKDSNIVLGSD